MGRPIVQINMNVEEDDEPRIYVIGPVYKMDFVSLNNTLNLFMPRNAEKSIQYIDALTRCLSEMRYAIACRLYMEAVAAEGAGAVGHDTGDDREDQQPPF